MITPIEAIRLARSCGNTFIAIDKSKSWGSYIHKPYKTRAGIWKSNKGGYRYIGSSNLKCNWEDSLIDVREILV